MTIIGPNLVEFTHGTFISKGHDYMGAPFIVHTLNIHIPFHKYIPPMQSSHPQKRTNHALCWMYKCHDPTRDACTRKYSSVHAASLDTDPLLHPNFDC